MTPETVRDIYHAARLTAMNAQADHSQPVVQDACDLAGWTAVIEAIRKAESEKYHPYNDHMR